jgi:hypothetical protein
LGDSAIISVTLATLVPDMAQTSFKMVRLSIAGRAARPYPCADALILRLIIIIARHLRKRSEKFAGGISA